MGVHITDVSVLQFGGSLVWGWYTPNRSPEPGKDIPGEVVQTGEPRLPQWHTRRVLPVPRQTPLHPSRICTRHPTVQAPTPGNSTSYLGSSFLLPRRRSPRGREENRTRVCTLPAQTNVSLDSSGGGVGPDSGWCVRPCVSFHLLGDGRKGGRVPGPVQRTGFVA